VTADAIRALGRKAHVYECDISVKGSLDSLIPRILADHSTIEILVNCAGIQRRVPAEAFSQDILDEIMQTNLGAPFTLCREVGRFWIENGIKGRIINLGSLACFQGGVNMSGYAVSKGGIAMLTKALSNEWASKGIRANVIAPGYIATDMNIDTRTNPDTTYRDSITQRIPMGRWGDADDFKGVVIFLASKASSYVTGEIIAVDGGWLAR